MSKCRKRGNGNALFEKWPLRKRHAQLLPHAYAWGATLGVATTKLLAFGPKHGPWPEHGPGPDTWPLARSVALGPRKMALGPKHGPRPEYGVRDRAY